MPLPLYATITIALEGTVAAYGPLPSEHEAHHLAGEIEMVHTILGSRTIELTPPRGNPRSTLLKATSRGVVVIPKHVARSLLENLRHQESVPGTDSSADPAGPVVVWIVARNDTEPIGALVGPFTAAADARTWVDIGAVQGPVGQTHPARVAPHVSDIGTNAYAEILTLQEPETPPVQP